MQCVKSERKVEPRTCRDRSTLSLRLSLILIIGIGRNIPLKGDTQAEKFSANGKAEQTISGSLTSSIRQSQQQNKIPQIVCWTIRAWPDFHYYDTRAIRENCSGIFQSVAISPEAELDFLILSCRRKAYLVGSECSQNIHPSTFFVFFGVDWTQLRQNRKIESRWQKGSRWASARLWKTKNLNQASP